MKLIIGIDFSLSSVGITLTDGKKYNFLNILNLKKFSSAKNVTKESVCKLNPLINNFFLLNDLNIIPIIREPMKEYKKEKIQDFDKFSIKEITMNKQLIILLWFLIHC
jgi:hypothetical protein